MVLCACVYVAIIMKKTINSSRTSSSRRIGKLCFCFRYVLCSFASHCLIECVSVCVCFALRCYCCYFRFISFFAFQLCVAVVVAVAVVVFVVNCSVSFLSASLKACKKYMYICTCRHVRTNGWHTVYSWSSQLDLCKLNGLWAASTCMHVLSIQIGRPTVSNRAIWVKT